MAFFPSLSNLPDSVQTSMSQASTVRGQIKLGADSSYTMSSRELHYNYTLSVGSSGNTGAPDSFTALKPAS